MDVLIFRLDLANLLNVSEVSLDALRGCVGRYNDVTDRVGFAYVASEDVGLPGRAAVVKVPLPSIGLFATVTLSSTTPRAATISVGDPLPTGLTVSEVTALAEELFEVVELAKYVLACVDE